MLLKVTRLVHLVCIERETIREEERVFIIACPPVLCINIVFEKGEGVLFDMIG